MTITLDAPDLTDGYPSKGKKIGPAWKAAWALLAEDPEQWMDGRELAAAGAAKGRCQESTMLALLARMREGAILERTYKPVKGERGMRTRAHYRIKSGS